MVLIKIAQVQRGDVVVFKDPAVKNRNLIKRVVGIGGDTVRYYNKRLTINGVAQTYTAAGYYSYNENIPGVGNVELNNEQYLENLTGVQHKIITFSDLPTVIAAQVSDFAHHQNCTYYGNDGFSCFALR